MEATAPKSTSGALPVIHLSVSPIFNCHCILLLFIWLSRYYTLLGASGFRKGMDLYFKRHDNKPATCDDFRAAMADANGINLDQMDRWYSQVATLKYIQCSIEWGLKGI